MAHSTDRATSVFFSELNAALARANAAPVYTTDRDGNKVRVFTRENPCTLAIIRDVLWGLRVIDKEDLLETVGKNVFQYMLQQGYIRKDATAPYYWITKAGASAYDLPKPFDGAVDFADNKARA